MELLGRWHEGEPSALETLVERHLPWVQEYVSRRLGPVLRGKGETHDFVQETLIELLQYGPRFRLHSEKQFRKLLARIAENVLRDEHDWFTARRRALSRERPLPTDTVLTLDAPVETPDEPSSQAAQNEWQALVRLSLELIGENERLLLLWRQWDRRSFAEIGEDLGISEDAARMRCQRALLRLTEVVEQLRGGHLDVVLDDDQEPEP